MNQLVKFAPFFVVCNTKEELIACWKHLVSVYEDSQKRGISSRGFTETVIIYVKRWIVDYVPRGSIRLLPMESTAYLEGVKWNIDGSEVRVVKVEVEDILKGSY